MVYIAILNRGSSAIPMLTLISRVLLILAISWALWRSLRRFFATTDIDNLPGPQSGSFVKGNFGQLFNFDAWDFHKQIAEQFGRVARVFGAFGSQHLYIFDSKALHHIVVKDQYIFEETSEFIVYSNPKK